MALYQNLAAANYPAGPTPTGPDMRLIENFSSENALNFSGILVTILVGSLSVYTVRDLWIWPIVALLAVAILLGFILFLSINNRALQQRLFWMLALFITALFFSVDLELTAILSIVWIVQAAELYGPRRASLLLVLSISTFLLSQIYHNGLESVFEVLLSAALYGLFQVFALSVVQRGIRERNLREETALLNRELISTRELLSQTTAQAERVRIARDLHDILGHHMTALILNLEVANHSVKANSVLVDQNTEHGRAQIKAQEKVEQALALAKLLLGDIRTAVSELRDDDKIDLQHSIEKLTQGIPKLQFDIDFSEAIAIRSAELAETLLRCTQEAITNVIRHSSGNRCRISVVRVGDNCILTVSDNGLASGDIVPGNGFKGMQERVVTKGGNLSWDQSPEGFSLRIELPVDAD